MNVRRIMAILCLAALLPSCVSFQPYEGDGPPIGESRVRVTQTSGEHIVLESPWVENGEFAGSVRRNGVQSVVRIPLESVAGFEVPQPDGRSTARIVGGVVLVMAAFVGAIAYSISECGLYSQHC